MGVRRKIAKRNRSCVSYLAAVVGKRGEILLDRLSLFGLLFLDLGPLLKFGSLNGETLSSAGQRVLGQPVPDKPLIEIEPWISSVYN